jgi:hypothetical protein
VHAAAVPGADGQRRLIAELCREARGYLRLKGIVPPTTARQKPAPTKGE